MLYLGASKHMFYTVSEVQVVPYLTNVFVYLLGTLEVCRLVLLCSRWPYTTGFSNGYIIFSSEFFELRSYYGPWTYPPVVALRISRVDRLMREYSGYQVLRAALSKLCVTTDILSLHGRVAHSLVGYLLVSQGKGIYLGRIWGAKHVELAAYQRIARFDHSQKPPGPALMPGSCLKPLSTGCYIGERIGDLNADSPRLMEPRRVVYTNIVGVQTTYSQKLVCRCRA